MIVLALIALVLAALNKWYLGPLGKYAKFSGRASRKEYWLFTLWNLLIMVVLGLISETLFWLYYLSILLPYLAVGARRLHDTNRSAWWLPLSIVPPANIALFSLFFCSEGTGGDNDYGPDPLGTSHDRITDERPWPSTPTGDRRRRALIALALVMGGAWSLTGLDITLDRVLGAPADAWDIFKRLWPPAIDEALDRGVVGKVFESVYIAWIGTIIGAILSLPLAFLAATNVAPRWIRIPVRQLFNAIRAVPELIVAVIFIPITGLGPWAGTLAIGLHSVGTLGKWATEAIEGVDTGPLEAVEATGGRWVSGMRWGILPQIMPIVASFWLFRFEINVRASAVLGMIGAGGVGAELVSQLMFRNFSAVGAVLGITVLVVLTIDTMSAAVRRRIIQGTGQTPGDGLDEDRNAAALADLTGLGR